MSNLEWQLDVVNVEKELFSVVLRAPGKASRFEGWRYPDGLLEVTVGGLGVEQEAAVVKTLAVLLAARGEVYRIVKLGAVTECSREEREEAMRELRSRGWEVTTRSDGSIELVASRSERAGPPPEALLMQALGRSSVQRIVLASNAR